MKCALPIPADMDERYHISMIRYKLAKTPLLNGLTAEQMDSFCRLATPCSFDADEMIFEQNQYAEYLYILLSGEVVIRFKPEDGGLLTIAKLSDGEVFGWSSVLGKAIYTSGAMSTTACECARVRGRDIQSLCQSHPDTGIIIMERLAAVIADRLTHTNEQILHLLSQNLDVQGECMRRRKDVIS